MDKVRVWIYVEYDMPASDFDTEAYIDGVFKNDADYTYVSIVFPDGQTFEKATREKNAEPLPACKQN